MTHALAPVTLPGGALVLLAGLRWRRPEARLLLAMACLPHTVAFYEAVPLFLVPQRWTEACGLWASTLIAYLLARHAGTYIAGAHLIVWLGYLPAVAMVLLRPNVWSIRQATQPVVESSPARVFGDLELLRERPEGRRRPAGGGAIRHWTSGGGAPTRSLVRGGASLGECTRRMAVVSGLRTAQSAPAEPFAKAGRRRGPLARPSGARERRR